MQFVGENRCLLVRGTKKYHDQIVPSYHTPLYGTGPKPFSPPKSLIRGSLVGGKLFLGKNDYDFMGVEKNFFRPSAESLIGDNRGFHIGGLLAIIPSKLIQLFLNGGLYNFGMVDYHAPPPPVWYPLLGRKKIGGVHMSIHITYRAIGSHGMRAVWGGGG